MSQRSNAMNMQSRGDTIKTDNVLIIAKPFLKKDTYFISFQDKTSCSPGWP